MKKIHFAALAAFLSVPAAQAANQAPDLMPNLADGWAGLPPDVQKYYNETNIEKYGYRDRFQNNNFVVDTGQVFIKTGDIS
jgi:hypothetical protein